jgi:hypothetical protein
LGSSFKVSSFSSHSPHSYVSHEEVYQFKVKRNLESIKRPWPVFFMDISK